MRILIFDIMLGADQYILINLYNADSETEQCNIFNELQSLLKFFDINQNKRIMFTGDFNIFLTSKLEVRGGKPIPKRKSILKLVDIKESFDIVIFGELEILSVKILHLDITIPSDL